MPKGVRRWLACAIAAALASVGVPAAAHGPPASVTGIAARDDAGLRVVTLSEGLGIHLPSGWTWICPAAFGQELMPPAHSLDGKRTFVVGESDLFVLESDGRVVAQSRPDLSRQSVLELAPLGDRLFALRFNGDASDVVALDAPDAGAIWHDAASYQSITPDGDSLWIARTDGATGHAVRLAVDGSVLEDFTFPVNAGDRIARVHRGGGAVYVNTVTSAAGGSLVRVDPEGGAPTVVLSSAQSISGPVSTGSSLWAVSDATLHAITEDAATPLSTDYPVSCVAGEGDAAVLCAATQLRALDPSGPQGKIFDLAALVGPEPFADAGLCSAEWEVFRWDLSRAGVTVPDVAPDAGSGVTPSAGSSSGCAYAAMPPPAVPWAPMAFAGLLVARRLRRRRGSCLP